jgi:hypothetical protein
MLQDGILRRIHEMENINDALFLADADITQTDNISQALTWLTAELSGKISRENEKREKQTVTQNTSSARAHN